MPEPSTVLAFIKAVIWDHLAIILVTGVVPTVIERLYEHFVGRPLPIKSYLKWTLLLGAIIAVFLAWNDEYSARLSLQKKEAKFELAESEKIRLGDELRKSEKENLDLRMTIKDVSREKSEIEKRLDEKEKRHISDMAALRQSNLEKQQRLDEKDKRKVIRERLGQFIADGDKLKRRCVNDQSPPKDDYNKWVQDIEAFFKSNMDASFIDEFHSGSTAIGPIRIPSKEHGQLWAQIHIRIENLKTIKHGLPL